MSDPIRSGAIFNIRNVDALRSPVPLHAMKQPVTTPDGFVAPARRVHRTTPTGGSVRSSSNASTPGRAAAYTSHSPNTSGLSSNTSLER